MERKKPCGSSLNVVSMFASAGRRRCTGPRSRAASRRASLLPSGAISLAPRRSVESAWRFTPLCPPGTFRVDARPWWPATNAADATMWWRCSPRDSRGRVVLLRSRSGRGPEWCGATSQPSLRRRRDPRAGAASVARYESPACRMPWGRGEAMRRGPLSMWSFTASASCVVGRTPFASRSPPSAIIRRIGGDPHSHTPLHVVNRASGGFFYLNRGRLDRRDLSSQFVFKQRANARLRFANRYFENNLFGVSVQSNGFRIGQRFRQHSVQQKPSAKSTSGSQNHSQSPPMRIGNRLRSPPLGTSTSSVQRLPQSCRPVALPLWMFPPKAV
jgi:hypothetical protein